MRVTSAAQQRPPKRLRQKTQRHIGQEWAEVPAALLRCEYPLCSQKSLRYGQRDLPLEYCAHSLDSPNRGTE